MRASLTLGFLGLSFCIGGCRSEPAKTGGDVNIGGEVGDPGGTGNNQGGNTKTTGNPSGPPVVNYPGFEVLNDGRGIVTVQVRGPFQVAEQKAEGRIIYVLTGVAVPERVNRLPLVTQHFPTQVSSVTVEQTPGGANLIIDLREASPSTFKVVANEAGSLLTITLPRSQRYGSTNPNNDPTNFERPPGTVTGDVVDQTTSEGAPEDYETETKRRQRRSRRQPRPYLWRAITLPHKTLAPDLAVSLAGYDVQNPFVFISSGIRYGIIDQVEVELTPHTIRASPRTAYASPNFGITAGYFGQDQVFEIGGRLRYFLGIDTNRGDVDAGALLIGAPMAIHLGKWGRIDTGAFATLDFGGSLNVGVDSPSPVSSGFRAALVNTHAVPFYVDSGIPFHFLFQATDVFWFGIHHGISIFDLDNASETFALPLGAEMGITAMDDFNPTADLIVRADLPQFFLPGRDGDVVEEKAYQLAVWFRWFYHL